MLDHYALIDKIDALLAKEEVTADTKVLIQAFRDHANDVESRLKDLESLTKQMKQKAMLN
jgi:hypothetical protein